MMVICLRRIPDVANCLSFVQHHVLAVSLAVFGYQKTWSGSSPASNRIPKFKKLICSYEEDSVAGVG